MIVGLIKKEEAMRSIARRTAVGAALLLVMPVAVWISGWRWQPGEQSWLLKAAFWVTETVTQPWGVITHLILFGWFSGVCVFALRLPLCYLPFWRRQSLWDKALFLIKDKVQEPRPFVMWLEKTHHIPVYEFYTLKRAERGNLVKEQLAEEKNIPQYLRSHWQKETGFAFPSGHTMFAASWALLAVGLLWPRRRTLTIAILLVWATGVMGSRLLLGMHWPRDLVVATLISWALVAVATWLAQRICGPLTPPAEENREIAQREQES
ncbi:phosphatidylglycerophosphatase B [Escherichia coli]